MKVRAICSYSLSWLFAWLPGVILEKVVDRVEVAIAVQVGMQSKSRASFIVLGTNRWRGSLATRVELYIAKRIQVNPDQ